MPTTPPLEACPKGYDCRLNGSTTACEFMPPGAHPLAFAEMVCTNSLLAIMGNPNRVMVHDRRMVLGWDLADRGVTLRNHHASQQAFAESKAVFHGIATEYDRPLVALLRAQHARDSLPLLQARRRPGAVKPDVMAATYRRFAEPYQTYCPT